MPQETFADRLKLAMAQRGVKQVDLIRLAAERGVKPRRCRWTRRG